jgi:excisionase family DNA binding protein
MKTSVDRPLVVGPDEAARLLRLSRSFVYELVARGVLRTVKLGRARRILLEDIERVAREGVPRDAR